MTPGRKGILITLGQLQKTLLFLLFTLNITRHYYLGLLSLLLITSSARFIAEIARNPSNCLPASKKLKCQIISPYTMLKTLLPSSMSSIKSSSPLQSSLMLLFLIFQSLLEILSKFFS
jgi:hypothetical protein